MGLATPETVRKLQTALHAKAKKSPGYRFYALYDKMYRTDVLWHAETRERFFVFAVREWKQIETARGANEKGPDNLPGPSLSVRYATFRVYAPEVLLVTTAHCAVNCIWCVAGSSGI